MLHGMTVDRCTPSLAQRLGLFVGVMSVSPPNGVATNLCLVCLRIILNGTRADEHAKAPHSVWLFMSTIMLVSDSREQSHARGQHDNCQEGPGRGKARTSGKEPSEQLLHMMLSTSWLSLTGWTQLPQIAADNRNCV